MRLEIKFMPRTSEICCPEPNDGCGGDDDRYINRNEKNRIQDDSVHSLLFALEIF